MDKHELWTFDSDLAELRDFLLDLRANEVKLLYDGGYGKAVGMESYRKGMDALDRFPRHYSSLVMHLKSIEKFVIFPKVADVPKIEFSYGLSEINASIKVAVKQNIRGLSKFDIFWGTKKNYSAFSGNKYQIEGLDVEIDRLISAVSALREHEESLSEYESKEFKPANISKEHLLSYVGEALYSVTNSTTLSPSEKKQLVALLGIISEQISRGGTKWINIIGALGLALAILQSAAVAPEAYKNTKAAYDYLMRAAKAESDSVSMISRGGNQLGHTDE